MHTMPQTPPASPPAATAVFGNQAPDRADSPPATPPRQSTYAACELAPTERTRKHITIADEVTSTHVVPLRTPPKATNTASSTTRVARGLRGDPADTALNQPMPSTHPADAECSLPRCGGVLPVRPAVVRRAKPLLSIMTPPSRRSPVRPGSHEMSPRPPHATHHTDGEETGLSRRSTSLLNWSFFRQQAAHNDEDENASNSSGSSDSSARAYDQRQDGEDDVDAAGWVRGSSHSEARRDTIGHRSLHMGITGEDSPTQPRRARHLQHSAQGPPQWHLGRSPSQNETARASSTAARSGDHGWSDVSAGDENAGAESRSCEGGPSGGERRRDGRHSRQRCRDLEQRTQYRQHWTHVVLTTTSAILFVVVVAMSYALYQMTLPYWRSIWTSVLLSIVLHPRSRLRYSLYKGTCIHRMSRLRRRWARRGPFFGIVGAWCSLVPFASFVVMQGVFFFGLNKVERRVLVPVEAASHAETKDTQTPLLTPPLHSTDDAQGTPTMNLAGTLRLPESVGAEMATARETMAQPTRGDADSPSTTARLVPQRQRIVATLNGRRVLRLGMVAIIAVLSHLLLGIQYLLLMHVVLFALFALMVPFLPPPTFLTVMSRVWRVAIALFLIAGLTFNLAEDVLAISQAVRRTTSELVATRTGISVPEDGVVDPGQAWDGEAGAMPMNASGGGLVSTLWETYKGNISDFVTSYIKENVLQELDSTFNQTNMTDIASELFSILHIGRSGGPSSSDASDANAFDRTSSCPNNAPALTVSEPRGWSARRMWSAWFTRNLTRTLVYTSLGTPDACGVSSSPLSSSASVSSTATGASAASSATKRRDPAASSTRSSPSTSDVDWLGVSQLLAKKMLPYVRYVKLVLVYLCGNVINFFDSIYALMLFVFFFRYLTSLEHTVLYYLIAKLLKVLQPEYGEVQARHVEQDITVSFITLLQSFWHLTWFHFCITFCTFKWYALPTPFLCGTVSVILAIFPLVPKWMSPCAVAMVLCAAGRFSEAGVLGVVEDVRVVGLFVSTLVDMSDEWLLCVSRSIRGNYITDAAGFEREQLHPFVVGTALVLGFVAWGASGIVLGPLTVIVAKVIYDNWDKPLSAEDHDSLKERS